MEITELYDIKKIKKKISGKQARIKTVYELKDPVEIASLTQEIKLHRFSRKKQIKRQNEEIKRLIEEHGILDTYQFLATTYVPKNNFDKSAYFWGEKSIFDTPIYANVCGVNINIPSINIVTDEEDYYDKKPRTYKSIINYPFQNLKSTNFISLGFEDEPANDKDIKQYLDTLETPQNYLELVKLLTQKLNSCKFDAYYDLPPYLPKIIYEYLKSETPETKTQQTAIQEYSDIYHTNLDTILEIKKEISFLPQSQQEKLEKRLNELLETVENKQSETQIAIFSSAYNRQLTLESQLYKLLADVKIDSEEDIEYNPEIYFEYLRALNNVTPTAEQMREKLPYIYKMINTIEKNKTKVAFLEYENIHRQATEALTRILITYKTIRDELLTELTPTYQRAIYLNMYNKLDTYGKTATEEEKLTIIPLLLNKTIEEDEFIRKASEILSPNNKGKEKQKNKF